MITGITVGNDAPRAASGEAPGHDFGNDFADEYAAHAKDHRCPAKVCPARASVAGSTPVAH